VCGDRPSLLVTPPVHRFVPADQRRAKNRKEDIDMMQSVRFVIVFRESFDGAISIWYFGNNNKRTGRRWVGTLAN
jgi:hypothetical protein